MQQKIANQPGQIPLDLGSLSAQGREDFLIAPSNQDAVAWIDKWPDWAAPTLTLQGAAASGKSHLAHIWSVQNQAINILPAKLLSDSAEDIASQGEHLMIDGLDPWLGDQQAETTLFHLYNILKEEGRSMLMTMRMAPAQIDFAIKDLASRIRAAPVATIHAPDDELLAAILVKMFSDRQINVSADSVQYILPRMERSFAAIRDVVTLADHMALSQKRPISIPLLRDVLVKMQEE